MRFHPDYAQRLLDPHVDDHGEGEDSEYRGQWAGDLPHGEGVMDYSNGHVSSEHCVVVVMRCWRTVTLPTLFLSADLSRRLSEGTARWGGSAANRA